MSDNRALSEDFRDLLELLRAHDVRFVLVGAHALGAHGVPRATGDMDVFVDATPENAPRIWRALEDFGAPARAHGLLPDDLSKPGVVYQMGLPPRRIDLLTRIDGVTFDDAWKGHLIVDVDGLSLPVIGLDALRRNKAAAGRPKDLLDLALLDEVPPPDPT